MYLHVGNNKTIRLRDIVGIFDADSATVSAVTKKYLSRAEAGRRVQFASMELPKSFVLCMDDQHNETVYISQISSSTLRKRTGFMEDLAGTGSTPQSK